MKPLAQDRPSERGVVAIEFAIIFPFFLMLIFAVIEFGWFMVKYEVVASAVASMANEIQGAGAIYATNTPPNNTTPAGQQTDANNSGGNVVAFSTSATPVANTAFICAQSYVTANVPASPAGYCTQGSWITGGDGALPAPVASGPYSVAIYAHIPTMAIAPLLDFWTSTLMLKITVSKVVQVGTTTVTTTGGITGGCVVFPYVSIYSPAPPGIYAGPCTPGNPYWCIGNNWGNGCQPAGSIPQTMSSNPGQNDMCNVVSNTGGGYSCGIAGVLQYDSTNLIAEFCQCVHQ